MTFIDRELLYTIKPVYKGREPGNMTFIDSELVKPVYKGHSREPGNMPFIDSELLYTS